MAASSSEAPRDLGIEESVARPAHTATMKSRKATFFLKSYNSEILERISKERCISQTDILNDAIAFYAERGVHMEALIKRSIREALQEFGPVAARHRVLVRRVGPC
jgi:hypothetical protein